MNVGDKVRFKRGLEKKSYAGDENGHYESGDYHTDFDDEDYKWEYYQENIGKTLTIVSRDSDHSVCIEGSEGDWYSDCLFEPVSGISARRKHRCSLNFKL